MGLETDLLTAIRSVLDAHGVSGDGEAAATDDPLRAPLGPNGEWQPPWLAALAAKAEANYPGGIGHTQELGWDGRPALRNVAWPSHLLYGGCLERTDLTEHQRALLTFADQQGYGAGISTAGGELPAWQPRFTVERGPWTAMVNRQVYADLSLLQRQVERYFALYVDEKA